MRDSLPINDVIHLPCVLVKLPLQLAFLIDDELSGGEKNTITLAFVVIIHVDFAGSEIEPLRQGSPIGFAEGNLAIRNKTNGSAGRRQDLPDEGKIESKCSGNLYPADASHLLK